MNGSQEDEVDEWNSFLRKLKKTCASPNFKHPEFWDELRPLGASISLIHDKEANSDVSERGAKRVSTSMLNSHGLQLTSAVCSRSSSNRNRPALLLLLFYILVYLPLHPL